METLESVSIFLRRLYGSKEVFLALAKFDQEYTGVYLRVNSANELREIKFNSKSTLELEDYDELVQKSLAKLNP